MCMYTILCLVLLACTFVCACVRVCMRTCVRACMHTCVRACVCMCICRHVCSMCMYTSLHITLHADTFVSISMYSCNLLVSHKSGYAHSNEQGEPHAWNIQHTFCHNKPHRKEEVRGRDEGEDDQGEGLQQNNREWF